MKICHINGKEKKEKEYCRTCDDGNIFKFDDRFIYDDSAPTHSEFICGVCNTKYIKPRIDVREMASIDIRSVDWYADILNTYKEVAKVNPEVLELREKFKETGVCKTHKWADSEPIDMNLGKIVVRNCLVCRLARVEIDGETYEAQVMDLLSWLANKNMKTAKKKAKIDSVFGEINTKKKPTALVIP